MTPGKASRYSGGCFFAVPEKDGPGLVLAGCIIAEYFCSIIFKYPFAADGYRLLGEELEDRFCKGGNGVFPCSWNSRFCRGGIALELVCLKEFVMFVYADNAATTGVSKKALAAMLPYFTEKYGNPSSAYPFGQEASRALIQARETIARCLGALPSEITFTSGGSEADNQALWTAALKGKAQGKCHLIASSVEHHAVLHTLKVLEENGFTVTLLPVDANCQVSPEAVQEALRPDTCLVSVMAANNETGALQPIQAIGRLCQKAGVPFHTDAVQLVGHLPLSVKACGATLLSLSAHKFHGPKGVGVLFAKRGYELESLIQGGAQERGKRAGTENVPGIVGMAAALEEACANQEAARTRLSAARDQLQERFLALPEVKVHSAGADRLPGHLNVAFGGVSSEALLPILGERGICVSAGSACASGSPEPSHVLLAMGCSPEEAKSSLRFSLGDSITQEQIDYLYTETCQAVERLRQIHRQPKPEKGW